MHGSIEITSANIDENGNISISGTSSGISGNINCIITDDTEDEIYIEETEINTDGSFSFALVMPIWAESGIYFVECTNESTSATISLTYNKPITVIEEVDIDKNVNKALYTALKAERYQLDKDNDGVITITELNSLTGVIDLSNRNISDINGLQALTQVTDIYINNNNIENVDVLSNLSNLRRLDLSNNNISALNTIPKNLTTLHIENNNIGSADILRKCKGLVYLFADNNKISNVEFVKVMADLKTLSIEKNTIEDISSIGNCNKLRYLNLSENKITDVTALANCTALYDLRLSNNNITDISPLFKKLFFTVYVDGNNIPTTQKTQIYSVMKKY